MLINLEGAKKLMDRNIFLNLLFDFGADSLLVDLKLITFHTQGQFEIR